MNHKITKGFTLIELMLSMTFIAIMLIAIAMCIMQMATIYNRGETLRQVNQAARTLSTDMQDTVSAAYPFAINQAAIDAGRLCTGQFTYVWNTPSTNNVYNPTSDGTIRFVRVKDTGGALCSNFATPVLKANATELLETGDRSLLVRSFSITQATEDANTGQRLYIISTMLGTNNLAAIDTTSNTCKPPTDLNSDLSYCAVNEFTITVRAGIR